MGALIHAVEARATENKTPPTGGGANQVSGAKDRTLKDCARNDQSLS